MKLTAEELRAQVHYEPSTGEFTWLVTKGPAVAGMPAGCRGIRYCVICVNRKHQYAHRLAWGCT
jgi:hypothetical protein